MLQKLLKPLHSNKKPKDRIPQCFDHINDEGRVVKTNQTLVSSATNLLLSVMVCSPRRLCVHPCPLVCLFVCLSAGLRKNTKRISTKLSGRMGHEPRKNPLHFALDSDRGGDPLSMPLWDGVFFKLSTISLGNNLLVLLKTSGIFRGLITTSICKYLVLGLLWLYKSRTRARESQVIVFNCLSGTGMLM